jgi:hypothetical protein
VVLSRLFGQWDGVVRDRGSSFATYSFLDDNNEVQFYGGDGFDSSRRGSVLLASDTSTAVPTALAPNRYQIDSLCVTVTLMASIGAIAYDNTADDSLQARQHVYSAAAVS